jgi:hypothetical protein
MVAAAYLSRIPPTDVPHGVKIVARDASGSFAAVDVAYLVMTIRSSPSAS